MKLLILALLLLASKPQHNIYANAGVVTEISGQTVTMTLQNGHMFDFEADDGDWFIGDLVVATFDDNATETITDDIILDARYCGWIPEDQMGTWIKQAE